MTSVEITSVLSQLKKQYGYSEFKPHNDPLTELVLTILSQHTSDKNSRQAFKALKEAFGNWEDLLHADIEEITGIIKSGGLALIKAQRIQQSLRDIKHKRDTLNLDFLSGMTVPEAREWLKQLPGVGDKTANCVLLFALGKPALPVDTHIFRVTKRLELIGQKTTLEEAHRLLEKMVPADNFYEFHVLIIEHGRRVCIAQHPRCPQCILKNICPSGGKFDNNRAIP